MSGLPKTVTMCVWRGVAFACFLLPSAFARAAQEEILRSLSFSANCKARDAVANVSSSTLIVITMAGSNMKRWTLRFSDKGFSPIFWITFEFA